MAQSATAPLGVAPADQSKYAGPQFNCLSGQGGPLPSSSVNDEFCDCNDGSDEPGTGACAGQDMTLFYCANLGSTPRQLFASRVGDGICDCCDGSDEAMVAKRFPSAACKNVCAEQGAREKAEAEKKVASLRVALAKKEDIQKSIATDLDKWRAELAGLEAELPAIAAVHEEAKKAAAAQKTADEAAEAAGDPCMWRQTGGCSPTGPRETAKDRKCTRMIPKGDSGFCDCDGDGEMGAEEPGFGCDRTPGTCRKACAVVKKAEKASEASPAGEEEKPQVSEYAKWMEGAADTLGSEGDKSGEGEDAKVSEYAKWMEGVEDKMGDTALSTTTTTAAAASGPESTQPSVFDLEDDAKEKLDDHNQKITKLKEKLAAMPDTHLGYSSLSGRTLSKKVSDFNYKIEFFSSAKQDHTSLGKWKEWTGPRSGVFENGQMCWGGPARKLIVKFECGEDEAILDVFEPSRCVYEATVVHPGACDAAELEAIVGGTRVVGPREFEL